MTAIRDAATVALLREGHVLMGCRRSGAVFMPMKWVFPGGAVDPDDAGVTLVRPCPGVPDAIAAAGLRELWEETGLRFGVPGPEPKGWPGFGLRPDAGALRFVFRAVTPPGHSRRFDARFLLADARALADDPDALAGSGELEPLEWVPLEDAPRREIAFVTEIALQEVIAAARGEDPPEEIPFLDEGKRTPIRRL
ncbi:8-oxo-dGTP pyrophosphatase MutT (NUDIX family) [Hasllibacter halocynthiae]|uniref:8-oxo-dGTP pyrophosphatase MutT (NUDIX family) n=1 Tax=Hasllibacter halocynthiae TaxID=595589 RepID=A0A2T0X6R4_9RHOB|nr:NUDIX hydrolase [Hasllibacter halocynthiae]PRY94638.1 8-oxo-dGTP pyrophosphatase MutT (NUDIX family) [Hasllibacter halocynthiae]